VRRWNLYQRIAVLIALGVVLHVSCLAILVGDRRDGGWFAYAPDTEMLHSPLTGSKYSPLVEVLVFGAHVAVWTLAALWLLRDRTDD
jgi:hypothetical protein